MSIKAGNGKLGSISAVDGDVVEMRLGEKSIAIRSWWAITLIQSPGYQITHHKHNDGKRAV
jgi:hypothetical protein